MKPLYKIVAVFIFCMLVVLFGQIDTGRVSPPGSWDVPGIRPIKIPDTIWVNGIPYPGLYEKMRNAWSPFGGIDEGPAGWGVYPSRYVWIYDSATNCFFGRNKDRVGNDYDPWEMSNFYYPPFREIEPTAIISDSGVHIFTSNALLLGGTPHKKHKKKKQWPVIR